jgi:hypothetical protein
MAEQSGGGAWQRVRRHRPIVAASWRGPNSKPMRGYSISSKLLMLAIVGGMLYLTGAINK